MQSCATKLYADAMTRICTFCKSARKTKLLRTFFDANDVPKVRKQLRNECEGRNEVTQQPKRKNTAVSILALCTLHWTESIYVHLYSLEWVNKYAVRPYITPDSGLTYLRLP